MDLLLWQGDGMGSLDLMVRGEAAIRNQGRIGFLSIKEEGTSVSLECQWAGLEGHSTGLQEELARMLLHFKALLFLIPYSFLVLPLQF